MALDAELKEVLRQHCSSLGSSFVSKGASRVMAQPSNRMLFAKTGANDQVLGEAESLNAMYRASLAAGHSQTLIPTIHAFGKTSNGNKAFLVTDYKQLSTGLSRDNQRKLGEKLAQMHLGGTSENNMYGFSRPTHCGATEQDNTWTTSWQDFWADRRIGDLIRRSGDRELAKLEVQLREKVYPLLFNKEAMKDVRPAIIHGDLWSGNAGTDQESGEPIIFDPSSSYSHNEAELGIMKMFGGFGSEFFDAYHQVIPKAQPYYNERQDMYEAYHHLNHFVIFGGSYRAGAIRIFKKLIDWAESEGSKSGSRHESGPSGEHGGEPRGLRGGSHHASSSSSSSSSNAVGNLGLSHFPNLPPPPPPPGAAAVASNVVEESASSHQASPSSGNTFPPATPSQIADYFSQMICYLWFSSGVPGHSMPTTPSRSPSSVHQPLQSSPLAPRRIAGNPYNQTSQTKQQQQNRTFRSSHAKTASAGNLSQTVSASLNSNDLSKAIQDHLTSASTTTMTPLTTSKKLLANDPMLRRLQPKSRFLRFSREILSTTQVSSSVITLALIYVHRLKAAHPHLKGRDGSEFRLAISSLMLANKILDDNTYLNKTWAEISGMPLIEISKMEVEFWLGLKMELHMTKEDYENGLSDLQALANERNRAVMQRDAAMKRAMQQQAAFAQAQQQWTPYIQSQWSASSEGLSGHHSADYLTHQSRFNLGSYHAPVRRSMGNMETMSNPYFVEKFSPNQSTQSAYDFGTTASFNNSQTPPYFNRTSTFTFPPSPLSQTSAGLNRNHNDSNSIPLQTSHSYTSNMTASSPSNRDRVSSSAGQSFSGDSIWSMMHQGSGSSMEQSLSSSMNPYGSHNSHTAETSPLSATTSIGFTPVDYVSWNGRPALSTQNSTTLSGLKRDFEKTNLDPSSPFETQQGSSSKRFAAEPDISDELRHYQLSSSASRRTSQSPTEMRYSLRSHSRSRAAIANQAPNQAQRSASRESFRTSASPNHLTSISRQVSPATTMQRSTSHLPRPISANEVHSHHRQPHPNYHSVFTSALTPNALAAPLEDPSSQSCHHPAWHGLPNGTKKVGPLQYYSLAAGEPFGNIGTYLPPPINRTGGWNLDITGTRRTSMLAEARLTHVAGTESEDQNNGNWANHYGVGPNTPLSAPSFQNDNFSTDAANGFGYHSKDDLMSSTPSRLSAAPFSLDVHAWPLTNSTSTNFLFPYHLLSPQSQAQTKQQHYNQPQHFHMIP